MNFSKKNDEYQTNNKSIMSKTLALIFIFMLSVFTSQAQNETKVNTITVTVKNIKNTNGKVILSLHNADTFMKGKGLEMKTSEIEGDSLIITFNNTKSGEYAIMVVHDENNNNQMDFELNGMPKESYGMSNNPILYGPPTFDVAKFTIKDEDANIAIRF